LGAGLIQLDEQAGVLLVVEQSAVGATQAFPHWPQFVGWVRSVSQPSSGFAVQWVNPAVHADAGMEQMPAWQVIPVTPGLTLGSPEQS
jgi:hypothetical protein